ncbi:1894_t:CDS:2 [Acaulospora colombiana]|uniref:1894_t:CDS:1 n=1 Tax=Acaulospora colombiana TaxID=27376 RepID=A0ACA9NRM5_9GLOM|nr:1894_t:CDS:2 [Acaulospora colombiana]
MDKAPSGGGLASLILSKNLNMSALKNLSLRELDDSDNGGLLDLAMESGQTQMTIELSIWSSAMALSHDLLGRATKLRVYTVTDKYSVLRHSRPFVLYRSTKTTVPISIFGSQPLPKKRRVFLQKRGYRTGLFGWAIGSLLGGSKLPGIEVTPATQESYSAIPASLQSSFKKDIENVWRPYNLTNHKLLESMQIAVSPTFRIVSVTWASASPQGASIAGLITHWTPGPVKSFIVKNAYQYAGGPDPQTVDEQYRITERMKKAQENFNRKIPYGAASIRTIYDLEKDEELGRQGAAEMYPELLTLQLNAV